MTVRIVYKSSNPVLRPTVTVRRVLVLREIGPGEVEVQIAGKDPVRHENVLSVEVTDVLAVAPTQTSVMQP